MKNGLFQRAATVPRRTNIAAAVAVPRARLLAVMEGIIRIGGYAKSMRLRDKFQVFAGGLLLAFIAAFALAAAAAPIAEPAAKAQASSTSEQPDLSRVSLRGVIPEHASTCFERHYLCGPGGIAPAPAASAGLDAMPGTGFVKAPALLPVPMPDVAPHAAASLSILFRNFRE